MHVFAKKKMRAVFLKKKVNKKVMRRILVRGGDLTNEIKIKKKP